MQRAAVADRLATALAVQQAARLKPWRARPGLAAWARWAGPSRVHLPPWAQDPALANHQRTPLGLIDGEPMKTASYDLACLSFGPSHAGAPCWACGAR